jgi:hypothetical protein
MNDRAKLELPVLSRDIEAKEQELSVSVIFTNESATMSALKRAGELASQLDARIRILVAQVVPYQLPIDRPDVKPEFRVRRFLNLSIEDVKDVQIDVRLCRDASDCLKQALSPESLVLIGGKARRLGRERRLAHKLTLAGHHVIFVPQA